LFAASFLGLKGKNGELKIETFIRTGPLETEILLLKRPRDYGIIFWKPKCPRTSQRKDTKNI